MYTDTEILCPYFQDFSPEVQQLVLDELFHFHQSPSSMIESSLSSEYELGGQGDLFGAPELVFHEPIASLDPILDPMEASISMIPFVDQNFMPTQDHKFIDSENELFDKILYECKNDTFVNSSTETHQINEIMDTIEKQLMNESAAFEKSVSTGSLNSSMVDPLSLRPSFLDFSELDFGAAYGMRRAFSEGDVKTLGSANSSFIPSSFQWPRVTGGSCSSEERQEKISRYRIKKLKRNFGRKIKVTMINYSSIVWGLGCVWITLDNALSVCLPEGSSRQPTKDPRKICQDARHPFVSKCK